MYGKTHQLPKLNFKEESYWQLLMGVTGNVKSGWRKFSLQNSFPYTVQKREVTKEGSATFKEDQDTQKQ